MIASEEPSSGGSRRNGMGKFMRVLHVIAGMNRGGVETWLMNLLRCADRSQVQMDFLVHVKEECAYDNEIQALGSAIIRCPDPQMPWTYARQFRRAIKCFGPYDVVHSHVYWFSGYVMSLARGCSVPCRIVHMYPIEDLRGRGLARSLYRKAMVSCIRRYATGILGDSQTAIQAFLRASGPCSLPVSVVYPVVDLAPFKRQVNRESVRRQHGLPVDVPVVLYVARFYPHKNHKAVFDVARLVNAERKMAHFVMVGSHGPLLEDLQERVRHNPDVSILTGVDDVASIMAASDLFFFPSLHEGFGIVALEAQAAGLPVIASDLPSIREVLMPSLWPMMFHPPSDLEKAARDIRRLLCDEALRHQLMQSRHEWISSFEIQNSVHALMHFYATARDRCSCVS